MTKVFNDVIYKSDEAAQRACVKWQKILRLSDWGVNVSIVRASTMSDHTAGGNNYNLQRKQSMISLLDPADFDVQFVGAFPQDHEQALVHELLHLHTAWWPSKEDTTERDLEEQMINMLSDAFVELVRR